MKKIILSLLSSLLLISLSAQEKDLSKGSVSYVTSQNVYVKFQSTKGLQAGDTLMIMKEGEAVPALLINNLSSISCVCSPLGDFSFTEGQEIIAPERKFSKEEKPVPQEEEGVKKTEQDPMDQNEEGTSRAEQKKESKQKIYGRVGIASYSNFSSEDDQRQRMRYVMSVNGKNIDGSGLGFESYIAFTHRDEQWDLIQANIYEGLKIYGLSLNYTFKDESRILLGRKINRKLSSMGAVDGLQYEKQFGDFSAGVLLGTRPDLEDYSFDASLFQAGAYLAHEKQENGKFYQSSIAVVDQENKWNTDRRFLYLQHSSSLVKNLMLFLSGEVDLYERIEGVEQSTFNLTNAYVSLRYRIRTNLRMSASYSARNNIIYYETYKDFIQKLIEYETMQGVRLSLNYRPIPLLSLGVRAGYRYRKDDDAPTRNLYSYATFNRIPLVNINATISATLLETSYIDGKVFGLYLNKDVFKNRVYTGMAYKYTDYSYVGVEDAVVQHSIEASLRWKVVQRLYFGVHNEFVMEGERNFDRLYISLNKRF